MIGQTKKAAYSIRTSPPSPFFHPSSHLQIIPSKASHVQIYIKKAPKGRKEGTNVHLPNPLHPPKQNPPNPLPRNPPHDRMPPRPSSRRNNQENKPLCFYLSTSETTCVALDCQPSHTVPSSVLVGGSKAYVILSELSAPAGSDALLEFAAGVDVRAGLRVGDVVDVLVENGRERYEFDADGVGCRFWVTGVLELLLRVGVLVDGRQVEQAKGVVKRLWPEGTDLELDRGCITSEGKELLG